MNQRQIASAMMACMLLGQVAVAQAGEVTGKVVAVFHETVKVKENQWADKVSVTVADCNANNQFVTTHYAPGSLSEDNALGFNLRHLATAARSTEQYNQYMNVVSGHATIQFDDQSKTIQKTTVWGHNWACAKNVDEGKTPLTQAPQMEQQPNQGTPAQPVAQPQTQQAQEPSAGDVARKSVNTMNTIRRFGRF